jgi:redox-sensitive bicupin YhaK (pirin superfamily)
MKRTIYRAEDRGFTNLNWLKSYHTFNFANYFEEDRSGFGKLMVLNEDTVQPGTGYGTQRHDNVEIISFPLEGKITHKDDLGNASIVQKGDVQVISAGKGITHSEHNPSTSDILHFLEIWILPDNIDRDPRYQVRCPQVRKNQWSPVIHPDPKEGALSIYQDAFLYLGRFEMGAVTQYLQVHPHHGTFLILLKGRIRVLEEQLQQFDSMTVEGNPSIQMICLEDSDILTIEIPVDNTRW